VQELAGLREQAEALTGNRVKLEMGIAAAREGITDARDIARYGSCPGQSWPGMAQAAWFLSSAQMPNAVTLA